MKIFAELKRRRVYQVAAIYAGAAWGLLQIADIIFPRLGLPDWSITFLFALEVVGFPLALILSWIFDYTPGQITVTSDHTANDPAGSYGSIAVLPFNNMSEDASLTHFADGLVEDLITRLQTNPDVAVNSRNSTFVYKGSAVDVAKVARELGAAYVVEGSVRVQGSTVRVTAQLIDARRDHHLWAEKWDRPLDDIFALQDELVEAMGAAIVPLLPSSQPHSEEPAPAPPAAEKSAGLQKRWIALAAVLLLSLSTLLTWSIEQRRREHVAREEALPQIESLIAADKNAAAFERISEVAELLPSDPLLLKYRDAVSVLATIHTEPAGVRVFYQVNSAAGGQWKALGTSPLQQVRLPRGHLRLKFEGDAITTTQRLVHNPSLLLGNFQFLPSTEASSTRPTINLAGADQGGEDMVFIATHTAPEILPIGAPPLDSSIPDFFLDRYEVTNAQFQAFVDAGAYQEPRYWAHVDFGGEDWSEVVAGFVDQTGQPGPAGWELGRFPHGRDRHPVTGVSWYEASAYARFVNKELPTLYHWYSAALEYNELVSPLAPAILSQSNFAGEGLAEVGAYPAISFFGAYDMGGNAREWLQNSDQDLRWIVGGAWNQTPYMLSQSDLASPLDRGITNGFRCMVNADSSPTLESLKVSTRVSAEEAVAAPTPVTDDVYAIFRDQFSYLREDLQPQLLSTRELPHWREERIHINSPYSDEGMDLLLLLPYSTSPNHKLQVMVFMPGSDAFSGGTTMVGYDWEDYEPSAAAVLHSGRALMIPVWEGSFSRGRRLSPRNLSEEAWATMTRSRIVHWRADLGTALDYLETRSDIDSSRVGYLGLSFGALYPLALLAVEERLKTAVLVAGGLWDFGAHPMVSPHNHVPRIAIPVLMLNGRYDYDMPLASTQIPLYQLLGSTEGQKKHVIYDAGHVGYPINQQRREIMLWLDAHLGKTR